MNRKRPLFTNMFLVCLIPTLSVYVAGFEEAVYGKNVPKVLYSVSSSTDQGPGKQRVGTGRAGADNVGTHVGADETLLRGNGVERINLGQKIEEVAKLYPSERLQKVLVYDAEGSYEVIEVLNDKRSEILFTIEPDCNPSDSTCIIRRINIKSSVYRTPANIRVGKYYIDLAKSRRKMVGVTWLEGNLVVRTADRGFNYVLDTKKIPTPWYETMDMKTIPDSTQIVGITVTGPRIDGMSYAQADSIAKHKSLAIRERKAKALVGSSVAGANDVSGAGGIDVADSSAVADPEMKALKSGNWHKHGHRLRLKLKDSGQTKATPAKPVVDTR